MKVKKYIKDLILFCNNVILTIKWLIIQIISQNFKNYLQQEVKENKLVILANGPSLKSFLANYHNNSDEIDYCVVNFFANSPEFFLIKPNHYVLADPTFFDSRAATIPSHIDLKDNLNKVDWKMTIYIPFGSHNQLSSIISNPNITVIPFHFNQYLGWEKVKSYLFKKGLTMPRPQNVAIAAIYIGIKEGYKNIELYGLDHSWLPELRVNNNNEVCIIQYHFYDEDTLELKPWHKGLGQPVYKMHEILRDWAWMFEGYHELQNYAKEVGCEIVNCTPNSYIDAFKRDKKILNNEN